LDEPRAAARIRGGTRVVGILGWPVTHSLSPAIHNAAFAATGIDMVYVGLPVPAGSLATALDGLAAMGLAGANVTMPHKTEAARLADDLSEEARRLGAVNTIVVTGDGLLHGHNTDAPGFARFLSHDAVFDPAGRRALVYGAGGAARAAALALASAGLSEIVVAVRDPARAAALRETLAGSAVRVRTIDLGEVPAEAPELVVNATPVGAAGDSLPLPRLVPGVLVVDLLYHPSVTPLQVAAREAGAVSFGGLGLLLHQAALSFELWTGIVAPIDVMSAAALAELADPA
jgi:shikimate dehydrogenase